jgi:hypothetical protein
MKMTPSTLLNIILVTILLTSMFFMSTRSMSGNTETPSNNCETKSMPEYDPWIDINDDGVIDGQDFQIMKKYIPSAGDPTKNVNVTNLPIDEQGNLKVSIQDERTPTWMWEIEKITILDAFSEQDKGVIVESYSTLTSCFYFNFNPKPPYEGIFGNVTHMYVSGVWRSIASDVYTVTYRIDYTTEITGLIENSEEPRAWAHDGEISSVTQGMHKLTITCTEGKPTLYLYKLKIFINYTYQTLV